MIVMNRAIILIIYKNKIENIFIKLLKIRYIILVDPNFTGFQISRLNFRWSGWVNGGGRVDPRKDLLGLAYFAF